MPFASFESVLAGEAWVLVIIAIAVLAFVALIAFAMIAIPYIWGLLTGTHKVYECCPPGLGCNDDHADFRACRRLKTMAMATAEQYTRLEELWASYCSTRSIHRWKKAKALQEYAEYRDHIYALAMAEAENKGSEYKIPMLVQHTMSPQNGSQAAGFLRP